MPQPTDELAALEAALARLAPAPERINIARLLFRAGQASVPRRGWAWPSATAASALAAAALGAILLLRPVPPPAERVVVVKEYVRVPAPPAEPPVAEQPSPPAAVPDVPAATEPPRDDGDYLQLRRDVLAWGWTPCRRRRRGPPGRSRKTWAPCWTFRWIAGTRGPCG